MEQAATNSGVHDMDAIKATAEAAYMDGYRTGASSGRFNDGLDLSNLLSRDIGDGPWDTPELVWQKDVSNRAFVFALGYAGEVPEPVPHMPELGNVGPAEGSNTLDRITADAHSQGARAGRECAYQALTEAVNAFAYEHAASLNVSFAHVDAVLGLRPELRPAGVASSDAKGLAPQTNPVSVARRSFGAPAAATAVQPPSAAGTPGTATPQRSERTSGRSR